MKKIIFILVFAVAAFSCNKQSQTQTQNQSQNVVTGPQVPVFSPGVGDPCDDAARIAMLTERVAWLEKENADLMARLDQCLGKKTTVKKAVVATPKPAAKTISAPAPSRVIVPELTKSAPSVVAGKANLDYLRQAGEIKFSVRVDGQENQYFPHYAMLHGATFNRFEDNHVDGYNWKVEPTDYYAGDYGVTVDGTFYVSDDIIRKSLQAGGVKFSGLVEITTGFTKWNLKPMTHEDGYWIFRTQ